MAHSILFIILIQGGLAFAETFRFPSQLGAKDRAILVATMTEVQSLLPSTFKEKLPSTIVVEVSDFGNASATLPSDVCQLKSSEEKSSSRFTYGYYNPFSKTLTLNAALLRELARGRAQSPKITCHHGTLYDQALATIIHELGHAFDMNSGSPSSKAEFTNIMDFKQGFFGAKNLNANPLRSPDQYEDQNRREAFAVNLEYFFLDEEYACRRPVMFNFYKKLLSTDPYPNRKCQTNRTVMLNLPAGGLLPVDLDPARVYRIDYLMAGSGTDAASRFGHSMYRLVMCNPEYTDPLTGNKVPPTPYGPACVKDKLSHLVVSFRANAANASLNYLKGIFGGYASQLYILTLPSVIEEYNKIELRDLYSYPMKLTDTEKEDFLNRVVEEHWEYRGSYKFFARNCATESLRLLQNTVTAHREEKSIGERRLPTITPAAVHHYLNSSGLLDEVNVETLKTKSEYLLDAYKMAYGYQGSHDRKNYKDFMKFVEGSALTDREKRFADAKSEVLPSEPKARLLKEKEILVKLASFSVIENQILRYKADRLQKKIVELVKDPKSLAKDPEVKQVIDEMRRSSEFDESSAGYGIPSREEIEALQKTNSTIEDHSELKKKIDEIVKSRFPTETTEMASLTEELHALNDQAIAYRENYRKDLMSYVRTRLESSPSSKSLSLSALREFLDPNVVSKKDLSDETLKTILDDLH